jgi:hypothetical protein
MRVDFYCMLFADALEKLARKNWSQGSRRTAPAAALGLPDGFEHSMSLGQALELLLARRREAQVASAHRQVVQRRGDQDLSAACERGNPGGEDDGLAEEVV